MIYQNHLVDPTFFYDAIENFSFDYNLYVNTGKSVDEYGRRVLAYTHQIVRGSLQSRGSTINRSKSGNTDSKTYNFYCKSLYRINKNDILEYKNEYFIVNSVQDYDEYGVREATLETINLTAYRDLADYIDYLKGDKLVWRFLQTLMKLTNSFVCKL